MASDNVIITGHAMHQIQLRVINPELVLDVAMNPQQVVPTLGGRQVSQSQYFDTIEQKTMLLRVIVATEGQQITVLTAYKTSRLEKYWVEQ